VALIIHDSAADFAKGLINRRGILASVNHGHGFMNST